MYPLITKRVFSEEWCVLPEQHYAIQEALLARLSGVALNTEEISSTQVPFTPTAAGLNLNPPTESGSRLFTRGKLGVIPVRGVIGSHLSRLEMMCGGYSVEQFSHDLELAAERSDLSRILVDFHSPGGVVTGVPEAAKQFAALGKVKDTYAFTSGGSFSASYWLMSQANNIYITESASVGSIGVYLALLDQSEAMKARGAKLELFKAGKYKAMGLPGNPLTDEERSMLQARVDKTYEKFTSQVRSRRVGVESSTMQGQTFVGAEARDVKLVDSIVSSLGSLVRRLS